MEHYSEEQASKLTRLERCQIIATRQAGLLNPNAGSTDSVRYGFGDLQILRNIHTLLSQGISFTDVRSSLKVAKKNWGELSSLRFENKDGHVVARSQGQSWDPFSGQGLLPFETESPLSSDVAVLPTTEPIDSDVTNVIDTLFQEAAEAETYEIEKAKDLYLQVLAEDPEHLESMINLSRILCQQKSYRKALAYCRLASRIAPSHPIPCFNAGVVMQEAGDFANAANSYRKALSFDPKFADAHYNLALVLHNMGDENGAQRHWLAYRQAHPEIR